MKYIIDTDEVISTELLNYIVTAKSEHGYINASLLPILNYIMPMSEEEYDALRNINKTKNEL